ncbi:MAG: hypothetical protein KAT14_09305 [Candidatus Marinimicrobia bacterium]|nr:hypothetical protein [Candidatus Neomarinimicrobiota bacterium]
MNEFLKKELERAFNDEERKTISAEDIKKWSRKTRLKQLLFILFESVILLGLGMGNILNREFKSFSFALGVLCLVVWPFLAINIHRYLRKIEFKDEELDELIKELKK